MAILNDDSPKGIPTLSRRQENWANLHLSTAACYLAQSKVVYSSSAWSEWAQTVSSHQIESLMKSMNASLLPKEKVQWIDPKNQRLLMGIERILAAQVTPPHADSMPYTKYFELDYESRYDNIMLNLDIWEVDLARKEALIAATRNTLSNQQLDRTKTKWLNREDLTQLDWALSYLNEHQLRLANVTTPPSTSEEKFAYVLGTLDQPSPQPLGRKVFLDSMRRAWSQYKYRHTGKSQRQVYFSLGKEARSKLEDAAEHQNRRKSDIVEELILQNL